MKRTLAATGVMVILMALCMIIPSCQPEIPTPSKPTQKIQVEKLKHKIESRESFVLVDVRPKVIFDKGHIDGAVNIPMQEIPDRYTEVPQSAEVIVYSECS